MLGGCAPPPSNSLALMGEEWGHSGFPQGTVHSFTLAAPTPICLTAHFIYDPKMNRPAEVPFPAHVAKRVSGVAESCPLGCAGGRGETWVPLFMGSVSSHDPPQDTPLLTPQESSKTLTISPSGMCHYLEP